MNFNSISTSNTTPDKLNNQVLFSSNPKAYLFSLSKTKLNLLDELARQSNISVNVHLSQNTLANRRGICRVTVNRNISALCEDGVVIKKYNHRHPCDYYLHPLFYDLSFRNAFRNIIMSFKWTPATLMLSANRSVFAYMNSCQLEYVTPLINRNFIKREGRKEGDSPNNNERDKNQCLSNVKHSKVPRYVTNRKRGVEVMSQSEIKISLLVQGVAKKMKLTEDQEIKLANYSDEIVKFAYGRTIKKPRDNPTTYLFKLCSIKAQEEADAVIERPKVIREQATTQGPISLRALISTKPKESGKFHKNCTAVEIAKEMATIETTPAHDKYGGEVYKQKILKNYAEKEYIADGSSEEYAALRYIDKFRLRFNMTLRCVKNEQGSPRLNENDVGKVMDHSVEKDSTSLIYERDDEYEEVTDETICDTR